jgi:hypothetical protein
MWVRLLTGFKDIPALTPRKMVDDQLIRDIERLANEGSKEADTDLQTELRRLFTEHVPNEIPSYLQLSLLNTLMRKNSWPVQNAESLALNDAGTTKEQLVDLVFKSEIPKQTKVNAALQALCKETFLGSILHTPRNYLKSPSLSAGRLSSLAAKLEDLVNTGGIEDIVLSGDTIDALKAESRRNPAFANELKSFPHVFLIAQEHISQPRRGFLFEAWLPGQQAAETVKEGISCTTSRSI